MKPLFRDLRSHLYRTMLLLDVESNHKEGISSIQRGILRLWSRCHLLLENAPCIATVLEAKSVLDVRLAGSLDVNTCVSLLRLSTFLRVELG